ncbi:peroxiredoxin [Virgibacillus natechei]|uniref:Peroxiredoxin n=1 Tax=Virgibacillus natechei TaxID=1216297 RepID=A0ABS4IHP3_9BACI|nr:redoxin domain-containing protein [Virgibacillus natechei]MBP1970467.1 peroxiredoxin [Virgibacillus natechei]UZD13884.1 redoxin domain-containing protein [Virgibacillus natechei]
MKKTVILIVLIGMFGWAIYDHQSDNRTSPTGLEDETSEESIGLEEGDIAPDFELQNMSGERVQLSDYRGERVMLNFWATWCPPCRAEMPDMEEFHNHTDIVILAVNLTETESNIQQIEDFVEAFDLTFPILLDEEAEVASTYAIQPVPTTFMIDSNGIINDKSLGPLNYEMMVQEYEDMH